MARQAVPAARHRPRPRPRLPAQRGDEVPRQPDRLGRHPVPPGHDRDRSTRRPSSTCWPRTSSGRKPQRCRRAASARAQSYAPAQGRRHRRVRQRARRARERVPVRLARHAPATPATPGSERGCSASAARCTSASRRTTSCSPTGTQVADRLFKIRHCMNIEGVVRQLGAVRPADRPRRAGEGRRRRPRHRQHRQQLNQPVSTVRGPLLLQKAQELCDEVQGARRGGRCSAIEKGDAEHLALLRQQHEVDVRSSRATCASCSGRRPRRRPRRCCAAARRCGSATATTSGSSASATPRSTRCKIGRPRPPGADRGDLRRRLRRARRGATPRTLGREAYRKETSVGGLMEFAGEAVVSVVGGELGKTLPLNKNENAELNIFLPTADAFGTGRRRSFEASPRRSSALIPQFGAARQRRSASAPRSGSAAMQLSKAAKYGSDGARDRSPTRSSGSAERASKMAGYYRRAEDYVLQANLATSELEQYGRQIISSLLREQIAQARVREPAQRRSRTPRRSRRSCARSSPTRSCTRWMQGELSQTHYECYKLAFDVAKRAEQTLKHELMRPEFDELADHQVRLLGRRRARACSPARRSASTSSGSSSPTSSTTAASTS